MKSFNQRFLLSLFLLSLFLSACSSSSIANNQTPVSPTQPSKIGVDAQSDGAASPATPPDNSQPAQSEDNLGQPGVLETLEDVQGNVSVVVTPVNIRQPGETVNFEITLDTHSVDLSMDLATLATLSTDTGKSVQPVQWDAPSGGHHVSGILSFPTTLDGKPVLDDAKIMTLTLRDIDVPERIFTWNLTTP